MAISSTVCNHPTEKAQMPQDCYPAPPKQDTFVQSVSAFLASMGDRVAELADVVGAFCERMEPCPAGGQAKPETTVAAGAMGHVWAEIYSLRSKVDYLESVVSRLQDLRIA